MIQRLCHINLSRGFRGGERQTELLIREISRMGVPQRAMVFRDGILAQRLAGVPGLDLRPISTPFLQHAAATRHCLVHAHEARAMHMAHLSHRLTRAPFIYTRRVDDMPSGRFLTRRAYARAAAIVAISEAIRRKLMAYSPALQPRVIPSVATQATPNAARVAQLRNRWDGKFVIGHAGALIDAHKGQSTLIQAARLLRQHQPRFHFVLLGQGRDEALLKQQADGLDNVSFAGQVEELIDYLAAFDLFAFPSRHEGLGSVLLEAMNAGLPVVASKVDGIPEIVGDEVTGLLIPPDDAGALASALERLYSHPALRQRMGAAGRERATDFIPARMAESYIAVYRGLAPGLFP